MSIPSYGALRRRVVASTEERNDHTSPNYQIPVVGDGQPGRVAVNVKSSDRAGLGPTARSCSTALSMIFGTRSWRPSSTLRTAFARSPRV